MTFSAGTIVSSVSPSSQRSWRWYNAAALSTVSEFAEAPPRGAGVGWWDCGWDIVERASLALTRWLSSTIMFERVVRERNSSWWSGIWRRVLSLVPVSLCG